MFALNHASSINPLIILKQLNMHFRERMALKEETEVRDLKDQRYSEFLFLRNKSVNRPRVGFSFFQSSCFTRKLVKTRYSVRRFIYL